VQRLKKYTLLNGIVVVVLLLAFSLLSFDRFHAVALSDTREDLEQCLRTFREFLRHEGEPFRIVDGKLLAGNYIINDNFAVPDKVQEIFGNTATVFMGDVRISTNVRREDGSRAVGSRLEGPPYEAVFRQGTSYRGEALILGVPYFTAYDPLRDDRGKIIGAIYVGMKKSQFLAHYSLLKIQLGLILLGLLAALSVFVTLFHRVVKKSNRAREADHRFLQTLIDTIPNPVFYEDALGKCIGCNKAYEEITGFTREELIGKAITEVAPQYLEAGDHETAPESFPAQRVQQYESAVVFADGSVHDVIFYTAPFLADDGLPGGLIITMLDITARKRAETELRESRQKLSDIIQFFPDATLVIDSEGRVTAWNRAMEELTGVSATEMLGMGDYAYAVPFYGKRRPILIDLVLQPDATCEANYLRTGRRSDVLIGEAYLLNRHGEDCYFHGTASPLFNSTGEIIGAIESIRDITERKRLEDTLAASEEQFRSLVEATSDWVWEIDVNAIYVYVSPRVRDLLGYEPEEVTGRSILDFLLPAEAQRVAPLIESFAARPVPFESEEAVHRHKDGRMIILESSGVPIFTKDGALKGYRGIDRDITWRKAAEVERERLIAELQEALANVKTLSGLIPICAGCKKIRDDNGYWNQLETYISKHSEALFSHGYCPDCFDKLYEEIENLKFEKPKTDPPA
jgi:PAS domain S-box-containing protein